MKALWIALLCFLSIDIYCQYVPVRCYLRNGTYVSPSYKTRPNNTILDNFSTKGNINPYTGKLGWINPDGTSTNQGNDYSNGGSNYFYGSEVGSYTIYAPQSAIMPQYYLEDNTDYELLINMLISAYKSRKNTQNQSDVSSKKQTRSVKKEYYINGIKYANTNFKPRNYVFWVPAITSSVFFPAGLISKIVVDAINQKTDMYGDKYFVKGYMHRKKQKVFLKSLGGFVIGASVNILVIMAIERKL